MKHTRIVSKACGSLEELEAVATSVLEESNMNVAVDKESDKSKIFGISKITNNSKLLSKNIPQAMSFELAWVDSNRIKIEVVCRACF